MSQKIPTVEVFSILSKSSTSEDMWDELNREQNNTSIFFYFQDEREYRIRLLGPFIKAKRIFIPRELPGAFNRILTDSPLDAARLRKEVDSVPERKLHSHTRKLCMDFIDDIRLRRGWTPCILTNAIVDAVNNPNAPVKILTITSKIASSLAYGAHSRQAESRSMRITGLTAYDILVSKRGTGLASSFQVRYADQPYTLPQKAIDGIVSQGLWDIKKIVEDSPKKGSFIYIVSKNYHMPDDINKTMFEELITIEENMHHDEVEESINDIPREAFENFTPANNALNSLEV